MKKILVLILSILAISPIDAKYKMNNKPAKPAGISAKHVRPSWMYEKEISVSHKNPYTGKTSKRYWTSPEVWEEAHQYRSTFIITTDLGVHYSECPYYYNTEINDIKGKAMPSFDFNIMYNFGGNLANNFGIFAGCDYSYSHVKKYYYENGPNNEGWIMDYRFGVSLMRYVAVGFQIEYNTYFQEFIQPAYKVDKTHYGFYVMGMYRLGHHIGLNASFSYIFNDQYNKYNQQYIPDMYKEDHPIMTDFAVHVGLTYYIECK